MVNDFYRKIKILKDNEFFDIIIDDGSHKLSDILSSLGNFYKNLKPGGFYIIEEFKYPNFFPHLNDCNESKIDELLNCLNILARLQVIHPITTWCHCVLWAAWECR